MGDKLHRREGNSPDHQLRPINDRSVIKEVGVQRQPGGEHSALEGSNRESGGRRSGSENVGLSNENIDENPMPRKPKVSSASLGGRRRRPPSGGARAINEIPLWNSSDSNLVSDQRAKGQSQVDSFYGIVNSQ
ncbi:unnamed protein product [Triticum turgidum subsp. durum]|uniref:Uncharacterized protein n=1 Tax=Triticum turgidum subsp. durum TaxID=4567 RepID=A0A9R1NSA3_TRITD|nr:unnamed protein product [Triticum turgidum subsp. durum]